MTAAQERRLAWLSDPDRRLTRAEIQEWAALTVLTLSRAERRTVAELSSWL